MNNRREIIEFLRGLKNGTRSITELTRKENNTNTHVLIQNHEGLWVGNGKIYTEQELAEGKTELSGTVVRIFNPHLNVPSPHENLK